LNCAAAARLAAALLLALSPAACRDRERSLVLATTTSTQDTGLLDSLVPAFRRESGIAVRVIAVGTGAALDLASRGDADAVLVHAPSAERKSVARGDLVDGRLVMHNDFLMVGPADDPARARGLPLDSAMRAIARVGPFVSRGDASGTHTLELALWKDAGLDPAQVARREETGQGMGATLTVADEHRAYTLTDRATYLALRQRLALVPLVEGDPRLSNVYHGYVVNPMRHPSVKKAEAESLVAFLVSPATQGMIGRFGVERFGRPLFVPDAGKADTAVGAAR